MEPIAYITDLHLGEAFPIEHGVDAISNWQAVLKEIEKRGIKKVVLGGDLGEPEHHASIFKAMEAYSWNISLGNHDAFSSLQPFLTNKEDAHPSGQHNAIEEDESQQYIFLDSSNNQIDEAQLAWLQSIINPKKRIFLFVHHPVLAVPTTVDRGPFALKNRKSLAELLHQSNAEVHIFCGHYHMADERQEKNIHQYVSPAVSYQVVKAAVDIEISKEHFGFRIIHPSTNQLHTELLILYP